MATDNPYIEFPRQLTPTVEKGPIPILKLAFTVNIRGIEGPIPAGPYYLWRTYAEVRIQGVQFPVYGTEDTQLPAGKLEYSTATEVALRCPLDRTLVDAVERVRVNNVQLSVRLGMILAKGGAAPWRTSQSATDTLPESTWREILEQAGHSASWLLYVERPTIEGWDGVARFLRQAHERLQARDAKGTLLGCREAIRASKTLVDGGWGDLAKVIDSGRTSSPKFDPKSSRVRDLRDQVLYFVDSAAHAEDNGEPSIWDAEFGYGLTCNLLAFLSRIQAQAEAA